MNQATERMVEDLVHTYADTKSEEIMKTIMEVIKGELRFQSQMTATAAVIEHIKTSHNGNKN